MDGWPGVVERKLARPQLREGIIVRPRVQRRFDAAPPLALVLVAAPGGYGKTIAVANWMARLGSAVAWVTVDPRDDDPVRLWTHVAVGAERALAGSGAAALALLDSASASVEPAIDALASGLARDGGALALVLDNFHTIGDERCLHSVDYALGVLPANVRVVIATRVNPRLRIARLRSEGLLTEVRARRLAFTLAETRTLLVRNEGLALDDAQVRTLAERTEGWPAALYLAALWLRRAPDPRRAVAEFAGTERHVADYFASEVLHGLAPDLHAFLTRTAVLEAFSAEVCDAVLQATDSRAMIARVQRRNLFVVALDQAGWYRYHDLFRDLLLAHLEPPEARRLHGRAAEWLARNGFVEEAAEQLYASGDDEALAELLDQNHLELARGGRATTLVRWIARLPDSVLQERPGLIVAGAIAATLIARSADEIRRLLAAAERARRAHPETWTPYHAAAAQLMRAHYTEDDAGEAVAASEEAVRLTRAGAGELAVSALAVLAGARYLAGDEDGAEAAARETLEHPDAVHDPHGHAGALTALGLVALARGRPLMARGRVDAALAVVREAGIADSPSAGTADVADALVTRAEGRLADAERAAEHGIEVRGASGGVRQAWMRLALADIRIERGRLAAAEPPLAFARELLAGCTDPGIVAARLDEVEAALERARDGARTRVEAPTPAELAVLRRLPSPESTREIAAALYLSVNTVKSHLRALYRKLGASSREQAVARAHALGLLDERSP